MMRITIQYEAQARRAAGVSSETIELMSDACANDCIRQVADAHGGQLRSILITQDGNVQPTLLIFRNDDQIVPDDQGQLSDGDTLTLMTPISGG